MTRGWIRTTSPPKVTTTDLSEASRPTSAVCWAMCTASRSQSWTETKVSLAPSPTSSSTLAARVPVPVWLITTTASANGLTSITTWAKRVPPSPCTSIFTGSVSTVSLGTVTTSACSKELYACAATRSTGL